MDLNVMDSIASSSHFRQNSIFPSSTSSIALPRTLGCQNQFMPMYLFNWAITSCFSLIIFLHSVSTIDSSSLDNENSTSSPLFQSSFTTSSSDELIPQMITGSTEGIEVPGSILDAGGDSSLDQYFWERVANGKDCPLNCSANSLHCWRLAGYLIPFICLPPKFDPNISIDQPNGQQQIDWFHWFFSLTNTELVILALLAMNTFVGIFTCLCICVRRRCFSRK